MLRSSRARHRRRASRAVAGVGRTERVWTVSGSRCCSANNGVVSCGRRLFASGLRSSPSLRTPLGRREIQSGPLPRRRRSGIGSQRGRQGRLYRYGHDRGAGQLCRAVVMRRDPAGRAQHPQCRRARGRRQRHQLASQPAQIGFRLMPIAASIAVLPSSKWTIGSATKAVMARTRA